MTDPFSAPEGPPPAYTQQNANSTPVNSPANGQQQQPVGDTMVGRSGRRSTGLFPVPQPVQRSDTDINLPKLTSSSGNRDRPTISNLGGSNVSQNTYDRGPPNQIQTPPTIRSHDGRPDPTNFSYETGQVRGHSSSVFDKGLRLAHKINPSGTRAEVASRSNRIEDVYLAVMGVTGAGKSSFIKLCTGKNVVIGHNLKSCTTFVEDFQVMYNGKVRLHLIDTPGFDDTHKSDTDVLRDIAAWLGTTYTNGILLSGIIYLHRISDPRMSGGAMRNLHMFKELCGKDCFRSVLLATTFWNSIDERQAIQNENELKTTEEFWGEMIDRGSSYTRHMGDKQSAWKILDYMIQRRHPFLATIQKEMVDGKLDLNETKAGKQLNADLIALEEKHIKKMQELEASYLAAQEEQDQRSMERIADLHERLQKEIDQGKESQADLVASLERINKERADELEEYKSSIEARMKEMAELRRQLSSYEDGSKEAAKQNEQYQQQLRDLQENLAMVRRRQPGLLEVVGDWLEETAQKIGQWWENL